MVAGAAEEAAVETAEAAGADTVKVNGPTPSHCLSMTRSPMRQTLAPSTTDRGGCRYNSMNWVQYRAGKLTRMFHRCNHVIKGASRMSSARRPTHSMSTRGAAAQRGINL